MRVLAGVSLVVAIAAVVVSVIALHDAQHASSRTEAARARVAALSEQTEALHAQLSRTRTRLARAEPDAAAMQYLCYAGRHAHIAAGSAYPLTVARAIIRGITDSCNTAGVSARP